MLRIIRFVTLILMALALASPCYAKLPKELTQKLKERYYNKTMVVVHPKILVEREAVLGYVNYDYFHPPLVMPNRFASRNRLNEYTTENISENSITVPIQVGEQIRIWSFKAENPVYSMQRRELGKDAAVIEMRFVAMTGGRQHIARTGSEQSYFVAKFRFLFPPREEESLEDYHRTIVGAIDQFFIPLDEYYAREKASRNISIDPGMSMDEVIQILGEPIQTVKFGNKVVFKYADLTVELVEDKVTDVNVP